MQLLRTAWYEYPIIRNQRQLISPQILRQTQEKKLGKRRLKTFCSHMSNFFTWEPWFIFMLCKIILKIFITNPNKMYISWMCWYWWLVKYSEEIWHKQKILFYLHNLFLDIEFNLCCRCWKGVKIFMSLVYTRMWLFFINNKELIQNETVSWIKFANMGVTRFEIWKIGLSQPVFVSFARSALTLSLKSAGKTPCKKIN